MTTTTTATTRAISFEEMASLNGQSNSHSLRKVPVDEVKEGSCVYVKSMSLGERLHFEDLIEAPDDASEADRKKMRRQWVIKLAAACMCDEHGRCFFDQSSPESMQRMEKLNYTAIQRVIDAAIDINGMKAEESEKAEEKNSDAAPSSATP